MLKPAVMATGSSGNVGKAFVQYLSAKHHEKVIFMFLCFTVVVLTIRPTFALICLNKVTLCYVLVIDLCSVLVIICSKDPSTLVIYSH